MGVVAVVLIGQTATNKIAKVVEAEKVIIRDPQGNVRATLSAESNVVGLWLYDENNTLRLILNTTSDGSQLQMVNQNGSFGVDLGTSHSLRGSRLGLKPEGSVVSSELYGWSIKTDTGFASLSLDIPKSGGFLLIGGYGTAPVMILRDKNRPLWTAP